MRVRLTTRWGSHLPNSTVSVSDARAKALVEAGIARYLPGESPENPVEKVEAAEEEPARTLESVKTRLDALGVKYNPRIGLEKAQERLNEALAEKQ